MPPRTLPAGAIKLKYMRMQLLLIWHYDLQYRTLVLADPMSVCCYATGWSDISSVGVGDGA